MPFNIHDRARQLVAQSRAPLDLNAAYRELSRRAQEARARRSLGFYAPRRSTNTHLNTIETPAGSDSWRVSARLPYADA